MSSRHCARSLRCLSNRYSSNVYPDLSSHCRYAAAAINAAQVQECPHALKPCIPPQPRLITPDVCRYLRAVSRQRHGRRPRRRSRCCQRRSCCRWPATQRPCSRSCSAPCRPTTRRPSWSPSSRSWLTRVSRLAGEVHGCCCEPCMLP